MFVDGEHFEAWMNNVFYYADGVKRYHHVPLCTDYWDSDYDYHHTALRHISSEAQAVFRVAAHLKVKRAELDAFAFIMSGALVDTSLGRRWDSVPFGAHVSQDKVFERLKEPQAYAYVLRTLRTFTGFGTDVLQYVCNAHDNRIPAGYVAALAKRDHTYFRIDYPESQVKYLATRVPAAYAQALRNGYRSSMSAETVNKMHKARIPAEYASVCLSHGLEPETVIEAWKAGIPVEYANNLS